ncbi:MAG: HipA domain-containing protein [Spirochaetia bacterium]|nr:HipA domain-containing protein [Spirochaetia bacterium]
MLLGSRTALNDQIEFFKMQILFWMLTAIDGHAKNFSIFIEPEGRFTLTPAYDVLSAYLCTPLDTHRRAFRPGYQCGERDNKRTRREHEWGN